MAVVPFTEDHLDAAAELLAARHGRHRDVFPELPEPDYRAEIAALLDEGATGTFAEDAFVLGSAGSATWGRNIRIGPAGHAARDPEALRDAWAAAAAGWVADGVRGHYVVVPATDGELLDAWFRLGFGAQQAHALREIPDCDWPSGAREATEADIDALVEIGPLLSRHQSLSPIFSESPEQTPVEVRADVLDDFGTEGAANLVYEVDGRIVGDFFVCPVELSDAHSSLARPLGAALLAFAVTDPAVRGSGAGVALTDASFAWARSRGYETMAVDWRVTNLLASRFWPRRGFRTTFLRLHRLIA